MTSSTRQLQPRPMGVRVMSDDVCAGCGASLSPDVLICDCGAVAGSKRAPKGMDDPRYCPDCESWHESDDRPSWRCGVQGDRWMSECPNCGSRAGVIHAVNPSSGEGGQLSLGQFSD